MEVADLQLYAEKAYADDITSVLMNIDCRKHYAIAIDTMSLFAANETFAHQLFEAPLKALNLLSDSFYKAAINIWKKRKTNSESTVNSSETHWNIHARLTALPNLPEIYRLVYPNCSDIGQFMCLCGTVIRATAPKMLEYRKLWKCNKCKYQFSIDAEVDQGYVSEKPTNCPNPEWCNGKNFTLLSREVDPTYCKDYQEIKIQEQAYNLTIGSVPRSMWIILEDDLVDICQPGNDVVVSGVLIQRWKPLAKGKLIDIDLVLLAHNVEVKNKTMPDTVSENLVQEFGQFWLENQNDPFRARDFILASICPQVFGLYIVKLAVALIMAGGVEKKDGNSKIRGDSHLLLVGDPGTGKSQFLKFASKVSMRSVLTTGIGTTNAGLTVSAVKEGGKWQLEAGALVLADGGICCIDEFSCIKEHDKTCIHEAMEQQTISVAKAGLVCSLSTRCSILAVTNPKGKYDEELSLSENTALASPLLSRFDVILVLLDTHDEKWDKMVSTYILEGSNMLERKAHKSTWSVTKMRNYFSVIRHIKPKVTPACERVLQAYYKRQRNLDARNYSRTTPRLLQSLIRLAEGHAKLMFRYEVLIVDAIIAIVLMESSMSGSSILSGLNTLHTSFPDNPKFEYQNRAETVLKLLNLENLLKDSADYEAAYADFNTRKLLSGISDAFNFRRAPYVPENTLNNSSKYQYDNQISSVLNDCDAVQSEMYIDKNESFLNKCPNVVKNNEFGFNIAALPQTSIQMKNTDKFLIQRTDWQTHKDSTTMPHTIDNTVSSQNQVNIMDLIAGIESEKSAEVGVEKGYNFSKQKVTKENSTTSKNEVTTLSDLNDIFSNNFLQTNDTTESFGRIFKKKQNLIKQNQSGTSMLKQDHLDSVQNKELNIGISNINFTDTEIFSESNRDHVHKTFNAKSYELQKNAAKKKYKFLELVNSSPKIPTLNSDKTGSYSKEKTVNGSSNTRKEFLNKEENLHVSVQHSEHNRNQECSSIHLSSSDKYNQKIKSKLEKYQFKPKISENSIPEKCQPSTSKHDTQNKMHTMNSEFKKYDTERIVRNEISDKYHPSNKKFKSEKDQHVLSEYLENQNNEAHSKNSNSQNITQSPTATNIVDSSIVVKNMAIKQHSVTQSSQAVFKRVFSSAVNTADITNINLDDFDINTMFDV